MDIVCFDIKKYKDSLRKLERRKAPNYIVEAYKEGYISVVNFYYSLKLEKRLGKKIEESTELLAEVERHLQKSDLPFVQEALRKKDKDFLKAFFMMTNMDIMSGERLPPNAAKLLKQGIVKDLGLKDLFKKLR